MEPQSQAVRSLGKTPDIHWEAHFWEGAYSPPQTDSRVLTLLVGQGSPAHPQPWFLTFLPF